MKKYIVVILIIVLTVVGIVTYQYLNPPISPRLAQNVLETKSQTTTVPFKIEEVASGLVVPWSIAFTSPERMLVSERPGRIREIIQGIATDQPLFTFSEVSANAEEGLMGLAVDPDYQNNKYIYAAVAYPQGSNLQVKVVRMIDKQTSLALDRTILDAIPAARFHAGTRLAFGPDNKLYITTGDATAKEIAQDPQSLGGKILRMNPDGSVPIDNPTPGSLVYALGLRNSQGIDWDSQGRLYSVDHGPSTFDGPPGGDEVNYIIPGGNYGWPIVSHEQSKEGLISPVLVFTPAVAPASTLVYSGKLFPQFTDNLFFGGLRGTGVYRIIIDPTNPSKATFYEKMANINVGRIRDIVEGPDGAIYFSTSNTDGRGKPNEGDDKIYRITVQE